MNKEFKENAKKIKEEIKPFSNDNNPIIALVHFLESAIEPNYHSNDKQFFIFEILTESAIKNMITDKYLPANYHFNVEIKNNELKNNEIFKSFKSNPYQWCLLEKSENITDKDHLEGTAIITSRTDYESLKNVGLKEFFDIRIKIVEPSIEQIMLQKQLEQYLENLSESLNEFITPISESDIIL